MSLPAASAPAPDRAPDAALRAYAGYGLKRAFNAIQADVNATLRPLGLRMLTFSALAVIVDRPGLGQADLAQTLSVERPNLVALLDELERAGLIARARDPADRRAYRLTPTARGRTLHAEAAAAVREHDDRMLRGLTPAERAALIAALGVIEGNGARG